MELFGLGTSVSIKPPLFHASPSRQLMPCHAIPFWFHFHFLPIHPSIHPFIHRPCIPHLSMPIHPAISHSPINHASFTHQCPFISPSATSAFFSNASRSTFFAACDRKPTSSRPGWTKIWLFRNGLATGLPFSLPGELLRFKDSRAFSSDCEKSRMCLGRKGTGVETRDVRNCQRTKSAR